MKKGHPSGRLRLDHWKPARGGPLQCCTSVWISVASASISASLTSRESCSSSAPAPPDADGLAALAARVARHGQPARAAIESMTGARFVHDQFEGAGWDVEIADAQRAKGLAPLACKTDRIDAGVLAELSPRDLVPAIWLPDPNVQAERERARFRLHLVRHRSSLKQRVHASVLAHGKPCPVSDLFGLRGQGLARPTRSA